MVFNLDFIIKQPSGQTFALTSAFNNKDHALIWNIFDARSPVNKITLSDGALRMLKMPNAGITY